MNTLWERLAWLFSDEEDPAEPVYDPVHVGGAVVISLVGIGALYWLLWTLLVFEGGLFKKVSAVAQLAVTSKTLKDFGYEGSPYALGVFEGWFGNVAALALFVGLVVALHRLYFKAAARAAKRGS
jgi:hypothetical protein